MWTNSASGAFGSNALYTTGSFPYQVIPGDVNNDGKPDLISGNWNDGSLTVLTNAATFLPRLALNRAGAGILVSWPAIWASWTLQQNTNLSPNSWSPFSGPVAHNGITKTATNLPLAGQRFFRLFKP